MRNRIGVLVRALTIFVGMAILLAAYYWVHRPFGIAPGNERPEIALRLGGALLDLLTVAVMFAVAGGIGRAALRRLDLAALSRSERLALEGGIGLGALALAALAFGLIGLYRGLILWIALIAAALILRNSVRGWVGDGVGIARSIRLDGAWIAFAVVLSATLLALALAVALAPPFHWDGMTYHLIAPARYLEDGRILAHPDNFYLGLSQNVEMLYGIAIAALGRDTAAAPVHFGMGLLGLLATAGLTRRFAGRAAGWTAVLLLLSAYNVWALFGWTYVDLGALLYGALALIAAVEWRRTRADGWIAVMGAVFGLALGVKYVAGSIGLAMGVFLLIHAPRRVVRSGAIFGVAALIAFGLWMVKGALLYGNPVYPFFFDGLNWDAERATAFSFADRSLLALGNGWQIPIIPVAAAIFGQDNNDGFGFTAGAWLLTTFLLLPLVWRWLDSQARRLARDVLAMLLPLIGFWMIMSAWSAVGVQTRLMAVALPAFAVAGALGFAGLANFPKKPLDVNWLVRAAFAITVILGGIEVGQSVTRDKIVPYLVGQATDDDFMYANTGAHFGALEQLATLPDGSQVRFMWEPRSYYCPETVTCIPDILFDHWVRPMRGGVDADGVFAQYRASGDDYLLFFDAGYDLYTQFSHHAELDRQFPAALERHMIPVWTDGLRYTLYSWRDAP
jgi:hypothetical protein